MGAVEWVGWVDGQVVRCAFLTHLVCVSGPPVVPAHPPDPHPLVLDGRYVNTYAYVREGTRVSG